MSPAPGHDIAASALLITVVEQAGGDLRLALSHLCACVTPDEISGETFQVALSRAVGDLLRRPAPRASACPPAANDA